jgi:hypothetical protein
MSDSFGFSDHIPSWLKRIPSGVVSFAGLSDIYGLNYYIVCFKNAK